MKKHTTLSLLFSLFLSLQIVYANPYASGLQAVVSADETTTNITYTLNEDAQAVEIVFSNGYTYTIPSASDLTRGTHTVTINNSTAGFVWNTDYTWTMQVTGAEHSDIKHTLGYSLGSLSHFYGGRGIAVDKDPTSKHFGRILATEAASGASTQEESDSNRGKGYYYSGGSANGQGLYAFDAAFQNKNVYKSSLLPSNTTMTNSTPARYPFRVHLTEDGRIFLTSSNTQGATIWEVNEDDLSDWTAVMNYSVAGINAGISSKGTGDDLSLLVLSVTLSGKDNQTGVRVAEYALGQNTIWTATPTTIYDDVNDIYTVTSFVHSEVLYDDYGFWMTSGRSEVEYGKTSSIQMIHYNTTTHTIDYTRSYDANNQFHPKGGGVCISNDGTKLVVLSSAAQQTFSVFDLSYTDGVPTLSNEQKISNLYLNKSDVPYIAAMCFDYADNLYIIDPNAELLEVYAFPNTGKATRETAALASETIHLTGFTATGINLSPDTVPLLLTKTEQLEVHLTPSTTNNYSLSYTSSDPSVATVSPTGLVSAVDYGRTVITVTDAVTGLTDQTIVYVAPYADVIVEKMWNNMNVAGDLNLQDYLNGTFNGTDYSTDAILNPTVIQAAGWRDTIFAKSVRDNNLYIYYQKDNAIQKELWRSSVGTGAGFCFDDAGNMVVANTAWNLKPASFKMYKGHGATGESTTHNFTLSDSYYGTATCYFITATGDLWSDEGGYVYYCLYSSHSDDKKTIIQNFYVQNGVVTRDRTWIQYIDTDETDKMRIKSKSQINEPTLMSMVYKGTTLGTGNMEGLIAHKRTVNYLYRGESNTAYKMSVVDLPYEDDATLGAAIFQFENGDGKGTQTEVWAYPFALNLTSAYQPAGALALYGDDGDGSFTFRYYSRFNLYNYTTATMLTQDSVRGNNMWLGAYEDEFKRMKYSQGAESQNLTIWQIDKYSYYMYEYCVGIGMGLWKVSIAPFYDVKLYTDGEVYKPYKKVPYETMRSLQKPPVCSVSHATFIGWTQDVPDNYEWGGEKPTIVVTPDGSWQTTYKNIDFYSVWQYTDKYGATRYSAYSRCADELDIVDWDTESVTINMNEFYNETTDALVGSSILVRANDNAYTTLTRQTDKTFVIPTGTLMAGNNLLLNTKEATDTLSQYLYTIPKIYKTNSTLAAGELDNTADIVVRDNATLTISGDVTVRNIYIYAGSTLEIAAGTTLTVTDELRLRSTATKPSQLINNGTLNISDGKFIHTKILADKANYQFLGLPFDCDVAKLQLSTGNSVAINKKYRIKYYDAAHRANTGEIGTNWSFIDGTTLTGGKGYEILSSSAWYREYLFKMNYTKRDGTAQTLSVEQHPTTFGANHEGWNLLTSPYTADYGGSITLNGEHGKYTDGQEQYLTYSRADGSYYQTLAQLDCLPPFMPFFMQNKSGTTLNFAASSARRFMPQLTTETNQWLVLDFLTDDASDHTILRFGNLYTEQYETTFDLEKFLVEATTPQVYTIATDGNRSFNALSAEELAEKTIPLGVYAPQNDDYTFQLDDRLLGDAISEVWLTDREEEQTINLLQQPYTTYVEQGSNTKRFSLGVRFAAKQTEVVTEIMETEINSSGNYEVYDLLGRKWLTTDSPSKIEGSACALSNLPQGVYLLRYANGETRKLLINQKQ